MNKIIPTILLVLILSSCSIPQKIGIYEKRKTDELRLTLDMNNKRCDFGVAFIAPISLAISFGEAIIELRIVDEGEQTKWEINADEKHAITSITYGKLSNNYVQTNPEDNQPPEKLIIGETYKAIITTEKYSYEKTFIFQQGETYITRLDTFVK